MMFLIFVCLLLPIVAVAGVFPVPVGGYKVQWTNRELIDENRTDPFNATHLRRLMVSEFTPVPDTRCIKECKIPYMSPELAEMEDAIIEAYVGDAGWPKGVIAQLEVQMCCGVKCPRRDDVQKTKETVLLDPGLNTTRLFYTGTAQHLAALGYNVVVLDHPYDTDIVQFPDGEIIYGGRIKGDPNNTAELQFGLDVRTADFSFVLDKLNIPQAVVIGHSWGGAAAASIPASEARIVGGVNLDGALWARAVDTGSPRPFLIFGHDGQNSSVNPQYNWKRFLDSMDTNHPDVWYKELNLADSVHGSFNDQSLIGDVTGLRKNEALIPFLGVVKGARVMEVLQAYLGAFVEFTLNNQSEGLLTEESHDFSDVTFLRTWEDQFSTS